MRDQETHTVVIDLSQSFSRGPTETQRGIYSILVLATHIAQVDRLRRRAVHVVDDPLPMGDTQGQDLLRIPLSEIPHTRKARKQRGRSSAAYLLRPLDELHLTLLRQCNNRDAHLLAR